MIGRKTRVIEIVCRIWVIPMRFITACERTFSGTVNDTHLVEPATSKP